VTNTRFSTLTVTNRKCRGPRGTFGLLLFPRPAHRREIELAKIIPFCPDNEEAASNIKFDSSSCADSTSEFYFRRFPSRSHSFRRFDRDSVRRIVIWASIRNARFASVKSRWFAFRLLRRSERSSSDTVGMLFNASWSIVRTFSKRNRTYEESILFSFLLIRRRTLVRAREPALSSRYILPYNCCNCISVYAACPRCLSR